MPVPESGSTSPGNADCRNSAARPQFVRQAPWNSVATDAAGSVSAVWISLVVWSAVRFPVPSVNEPHYLTKALHYWQPQWCQADLFLESSNPHQFFYQTFGVLTLGMTFAMAAWIGRTLALLLLAIGWVRMIRTYSSHRAAGPVTCWLFLTLAAVGNFSGEWLVGGIESKVPAYALVFLAIAARLRHQWWAAAICAGLAVSFHPVVGGWSLLAAISAELMACRGPCWDRIGWSNEATPIIAIARSTEITQRADNLPRPTAIQAAMLLAVLILFALPGGLPAVDLILGSHVSASMQRTADYIQVFGRLRHHLDPTTFPFRSWLMYGILLAMFLSLGWTLRRLWHARWLSGFVIGSLIFAACGVAIGLGPRPALEMPAWEIRMALLKFYPFRLFDLMLPVGCVVLLVMRLSIRNDDPIDTVPDSPQGSSSAAATNASACRVRMRLSFAVGLIGFVLTLVFPGGGTHPGGMSAAQRTDWVAACRWIRDNTPDDSLWLTPHGAFGFKWYAERAEYRNFKDCPQDATSLVEWNQRFDHIKAWADTAFADGLCSPEETRLLHASTGITHLVVWRLGRIDAPPLYHNTTYRVYATMPVDSQRP